MKAAEPLYDEKGIKLPLCEQPPDVKFKPYQGGVWARQSAYPALAFPARYRQSWVLPESIFDLYRAESSKAKRRGAEPESLESWDKVREGWEARAEEEAERKRQEREARNQQARKPHAPTDGKAWNRRLSESASGPVERWGLKELDTGQSVNPGKNPAVGRVRDISYKSPGASGLEEDLYGTSLDETSGDADESDGGGGFKALIAEQPPTGEGSGNRQATGRKKVRASAVSVTLADGSADFHFIANDTAEIARWLESYGWTPEAYELALARGRSAERDQLREALAPMVVELLGRGATQPAVAQVLGCSRQTVQNLDREAAAA